jgi:ribA/ribD-fused uncharacterized protein
MSNQGPIFFFHQDHEHGHFSQWYPSPFTATVAGKTHRYANAEQYMMHHKASLGASPPDTKAIQEILLTADPRICKGLGGNVRNFSAERWDRIKLEVVVEGSYLKFTSSEELKTRLLETGDRELVEASHFDRVWGVGFTPEQCRKGKKAGAGRENWGTNLLGKALVRARQRIRQEEESRELFAAAQE